ncbi:MAG: mannose-6-phosphate isomerase, class I, partial [Spirochaetales bacterium]
MINTVQSYAWGHTRCIPDFLNIDWPEGRPAAELWMGSHPGAPSRIQLSEGAGLVDMDKWIASAPASILGEKTHKRFGALPFLLKLLAAGKALSIQAHPDEAAAREGFEREERLGIPPGAPGRSYKDSRHKPEIIMALTPFTAMIGFREPRHTGRIFT